MNPTENSPAPLPDIKDIAGPETLPSLWEVIVLIGGIILGVAILGTIIFFLYRILTKQTAPAISAHTIARRRLDQLAAQVDILSPNEFSLSVSETLKDYLAARFGDPVRYETSEEFLMRLSQAEANALPSSLREKVATFLTVADEIKYGRPPDAEARKLPLLEQARDVLAVQPTPETPKPGSGKKTKTRPSPPQRKTIVS